MLVAVLGLRVGAGVRMPSDDSIESDVETGDSRLLDQVELPSSPTQTPESSRLCPLVVVTRYLLLALARTPSPRIDGTGGMGNSKPSMQWGHDDACSKQGHKVGSSVSCINVGRGIVSCS